MEVLRFLKRHRVGHNVDPLALPVILGGHVCVCVRVVLSSLRFCRPSLEYHSNFLDYTTPFYFSGTN